VHVDRVAVLDRPVVADAAAHGVVDQFIGRQPIDAGVLPTIQCLAADTDALRQFWHQLEAVVVDGRAEQCELDGRHEDVVDGRSSV
jgi:hypothetical protein